MVNNQLQISSPHEINKNKSIGKLYVLAFETLKHRSFRVPVPKNMTLLQPGP
jgi:hypothetical protein